MAAPPPSYTQVTHTTSYSGIDPTQPALSTAGKVVLITGASGGIGRATALSFALSGPRALILLGRRSDALAATASSISASNSQLPVRTHAVELTDSSATQAAMSAVAEEFGAIDILVHAAGVLAPVELLVDADPNNFLAGYKTTIVGTLVAAQSAVRTNKEAALTFINLTTAGILFPPFPSMGAYVSSKIAAVKLLEVFAIENPQVRVHHVHPGLLETAMSAQLAEKVTLPYAYDDSKYQPLETRLPSLYARRKLTSLLYSLAPGRLSRLDRLS